MDEETRIAALQSRIEKLEKARFSFAWKFLLVGVAATLAWRVTRESEELLWLFAFFLAIAGFFWLIEQIRNRVHKQNPDSQ